MSYYHLTIEDRKNIERFYQKGLKITEIAERIGVHKSTISRELKRNRNKDGEYNAIGAQRKATKRRKNSANKPFLVRNKEAYKFVIHGLNRFWSPEEISNTMPKNLRICTATIYRAMKKKLIDTKYIKKLRFYNKRFGPKKSNNNKPKPHEEKNIATRPEYIETRENYGHWELDTLVLRDECKCHLAVFVERKSRFVIIVKIPNKKAKTMTDAIVAAFEKLPLHLRKTLTVDNGAEFSDWRGIEARLPGTTVYYCNPHSPWQKGAVEKMNGLIRQFFPRKTILPEVTDTYVLEVQNLLNNRPRKSLNWATPAMFFVALDLTTYPLQKHMELIFCRGVSYVNSNIVYT